MTKNTRLERLTNPLVTVEQLSSPQDDDPSHSEKLHSLRYAQAILTQSAGILLRLRPEVVASSLVLLQRFWVESDTQTSANANPKVVKSLCTMSTYEAKFEIRRPYPKHLPISQQNFPLPLYPLALSAMFTPTYSPNPLHYPSLHQALSPLPKIPAPTMCPKALMSASERISSLASRSS